MNSGCVYSLTFLSISHFHRYQIIVTKKERGKHFSKILYRKIMASLAGPVPIHLTPTPVNFSMNSTYFLAFSGRAS
jgi:hypothetical protein